MFQSFDGPGVTTADAASVGIVPSPVEEINGYLGYLVATHLKGRPYRPSFLPGIAFVQVWIAKPLRCVRTCITAKYFFVFVHIGEISLGVNAVQIDVT